MLTVHLCVCVFLDNPAYNSFLFVNWQSAKGQVGGRQKKSKKKTLVSQCKTNLLPRAEFQHKRTAHTPTTTCPAVLRCVGVCVCVRSGECPCTCVRLKLSFIEKTSFTVSALTVAKVKDQQQLLYSGASENESWRGTRTYVKQKRHCIKIKYMQWQAAELPHKQISNVIYSIVIIILLIPLL